MRGLYPIVDVDALSVRSLPVIPFAERVLAVRPALLQLRAKSLGPRDTLSLLRELLPRCRAAGTLLFANDRPDLALLAGVDGVHVGQTDLSLDDVRRVAPGLLLGVSTHDAAELEAALLGRPDYVAHGPVFPTASKAQPEPSVGLERLAWAHEQARAAAVPLVAIGGIDRARAAAVRGHAELVAVIGALIPDSSALDDVTACARALTDALAEAREPPLSGRAV